MNKSDIKNAFTSDISELIVEKIMLINDIEDIWKLLLLMGIGVFASHSSREYIEIMKDLAKSKKLYLIIATSDYIYGTNYQFDHCYLGKDLENMTQEKIIQAIGRVGRNKVSDEYTIRVRDNNLLSKIFEYDNNKIEVKNMEKLFNSEKDIPDLY
jgi:late competence protein required for DNA uptake (superfamily II DNA/RNA helicase)